MLTLAPIQIWEGDMAIFEIDPNNISDYTFVIDRAIRIMRNASDRKPTKIEVNLNLFAGPLVRKNAKLVIFQRRRRVMQSIIRRLNNQ